MDKPDKDNEVLKTFQERANKIIDGTYSEKPATYEQSIEGVEDPELKKIILEAHFGKLENN